MKDRIWLTWERQRRNRTLSAALGAELYEIDHKLPRLRRWFKAVGETLSILFRDRPLVVFAQNPSLVLALLVVCYTRWTGRISVIDAHNAGIFPFAGRKGWTHRLARPVMQRLTHHVMWSADITLVSNPALAAYVDSAGGRGFVLPDPLPTFPGVDTIAPPAPGPTVLFICTWAADEPYQAVIDAAARIDPAIRVYITGNSKGREQSAGSRLPANVVLTGFVPEEEFVRLLHTVDVVMDLTTLENCLVCGAYEAVAAGKPMVLSDTEALRTYFRKGAVYTVSDAGAIAQAITRALAEKQQLAAQVVELKRELADDWQRQRDALETLLSGLHARSAAAAPKP